MQNKDDMIDRLNGLIAMNRDAEAGFQNAAGNVRNSELETLFQNYGAQHAKFAEELRADVQRLDGDPADGGTIGGAAHRGWMDLKAALSGHSAAAMIGACESGEDSAVAAYDAQFGLGVRVEGKTREMLEKHLQKTREMLTHLRRLSGEVKDGTVFPQNE